MKALPSWNCRPAANRPGFWRVTGMPLFVGQLVCVVDDFGDLVPVCGRLQESKRFATTQVDAFVDSTMWEWKGKVLVTPSNLSQSETHPHQASRTGHA